jgi:putative NADH-flavin reductase
MKKMMLCRHSISTSFVSVVLLVGVLASSTWTLSQAFQLTTPSFPATSSFLRQPQRFHRSGTTTAPAATTTSTSTTQLWSQKTIAVIGASGLTASECVYQILQNGDKCIGLTRNPSNLKIPKGSGGNQADQPFTDPNLTMIAGDVTQQADVEKIFTTTSDPIDGVIVALGGKTSDVGETMLTDGTTNVIAAMKQYNVKRLVVITSIGAGDSENQAPFFFKVLMWTAMKKIFTDKNNQERVVQDSGLEYCIVRPGGLTVDRKCVVQK